MVDTKPKWSAGSGEMGELIYTKNWGDNSIGAVEEWPENLRLALDICLGAGVPASICWGRNLIFFYNDAWRDLLGDKHPSALGRPARRVFSETWKETGPLFKQVLDTGEAAEFPGRLLFATQPGPGGGYESYLDVTVNPIPGKDRTAGGTFNIATQKIIPAGQNLEKAKDWDQAYDQPGKSEEKYRNLFESIEDGFCIIEKVESKGDEPIDFRYVEVNPAYYKHTGVSGVVGKTVRQVFPGESEERFEIYDTVLNTGQPRQFELEFDTTGQVFEIQVFRVKDETGRRVAIVFKDITQQKRAEQELYKLNKELEGRVDRRTAKLKASRDRLRIALEAADLGIWDLDLTIDSASIRSVRHDRIFGYEELQEEWGQEIATRHVLPEDRVTFKKAFAQARETGVLSFKVRLKWPDGSIHWIEALGKTYYNSGEQPVRMAGVVKDITAQKEAEEARLYYQKQLRLLASELSKAEEQVQKRLATELHDNLGQLLAVGKMRLQNLENFGLADNTARGIAGVKELVDDALKYTRELITDLKPPPLLNKEGIVEILGWVAKKMEKHGLSVSIKDPEHPKPLSEEVRTTLHQCVRELLFNVVKHAGVDQARIELSYPDNQLLITVEDEGTGFNPEEKEMVPTEAGGFGLFNIRERMNWLGGSLEIISGPGKGTKAKLYAPLKEEEEGEEKSGQTAGSGVKKNLPSERLEEQAESLEKVRILLVDDHQMVRRGLRNMIEAQDDLMIIAEASNGREAVELARETSPDIIVMDVNMPRMNGIEATREIISGAPRMRIIGLSLHKKEDVAHSMLSAGACAYLTKDQAFETLCSTIRKAAGAGE